jgi:hypothetical protein
MKVGLPALVALALCGVCEAQVAAPKTDAESVSSQIESSVKGKSLVPIYPIRTAALAQGRVAKMRIPINQADDLTISTACSDSCNDIDLEATDEAGNVLAYDESSDDSPVLHITAGKTKVVLLQLTMVECARESCVYGVGLFQGAGDVDAEIDKALKLSGSLFQ